MLCHSRNLHDCLSVKLIFGPKFIIGSIWSGCYKNTNKWSGQLKKCQVTGISITAIPPPPPRPASYGKLNMGQKKCQKVLPDSKVRNRGVQQPPPPLTKISVIRFQLTWYLKNICLKTPHSIRRTWHKEYHCRKKIQFKGGMRDFFWFWKLCACFYAELCLLLLYFLFIVKSL